MDDLRLLKGYLKNESNEQLKNTIAHSFLYLYCSHVIKRQAYNPNHDYVFILNQLNEELLDFKFHLILKHDNTDEYVEFQTENELNDFIKKRFPTVNTIDTYQILDEWIYDELSSGAFIFFGKKMYDNAHS